MLMWLSVRSALRRGVAVFAPESWRYVVYFCCFFLRRRSLALLLISTCVCAILRRILALFLISTCVCGGGICARQPKEAKETRRVGRTVPVTSYPLVSGRGVRRANGLGAHAFSMPGVRRSIARVPVQKCAPGSDFVTPDNYLRFLKASLEERAVRDRCRRGRFRGMLCVRRPQVATHCGRRVSVLRIA